ncbi:unnamed protein product [Prorocentrum cordatum]|uniref:Uncharacterized protein n=1 Tax=Prorocentrum cordatum TaxID=2364126 RepID=A0ABN9SUE5_9DINO|nr:unnamed protein product [Polarella glacialis]
MSAPPRDEQDLFLEEAFGFAAEQRFYLRKAIQQNDMENALRYSICLTNELRSSMLQPNKYYQLYALVFWELQHLGAFVGREERHGHRLADVYEMVQYEGNVLPRLYLLVTVGAVYMREVCDPALAKGILEDLGEMLGAVQHPVRGLFLRYYLLQMVKDKLGELDSTRDALQYLLRSLREAISLWSRLRLSDGQPTPGRLGGSDAGGDAPSDLISSEPSPVARPSAAAASDGGACHQDADANAFSAAWLLDRNRHALRFLVAAHLMHISAGIADPGVVQGARPPRGAAGQQLVRGRRWSGLPPRVLRRGVPRPLPPGHAGCHPGGQRPGELGGRPAAAAAAPAPADHRAQRRTGRRREAPARRLRGVPRAPGEAAPAAPRPRDPDGVAAGAAAGARAVGPRAAPGRRGARGAGAARHRRAAGAAHG